MNPIHCLIVDDEPIARDIIRTYCAHLPELQVVADCGHALEAKALLARQPVDLLFLDINMPVLDGIAFLKTLKQPPQVIFTTAYKEYAVDAFDLNACDYLLKPFSFERFIVAVDKARERLQPAAPVKEDPPQAPSTLLIRADGKIFPLHPADLLYAEARGNYTRLVTDGGVLLPVMTLSGLEEQLPAAQFVRVHRSFIVNKDRISHIEGNRLFIGGQEIPIGSNYKEAFLRILGL
ncbi:MAG TPA: LytTR family DNA-binding domain-containing protein [Chitinophagaceae bacterium]|jgi:DNA-binding LytR/AlgR family response regulator|nr:LytTR family DNA-binding domain-containing protein [Chitinophagaceae bacterium]